MIAPPKEKPGRRAWRYGCGVPQAPPWSGATPRPAPVVPIGSNPAAQGRRPARRCAPGALARRTSGENSTRRRQTCRQVVAACSDSYAQWHRTRRVPADRPRGSTLTSGAEGVPDAGRSRSAARGRRRQVVVKIRVGTLSPECDLSSRASRGRHAGVQPLRGAGNIYDARLSGSFAHPGIGGCARWVSVFPSRAGCARAP